MLHAFETFGTLLGSAWVFFFRTPVFTLKRFDSRGILLGPWLQAAVVGAAIFFLRAALPSSLFSLACLLGAVILASLTGFFHEDGLADVFDSLGVSPCVENSQERMQAAMKDSRLGSFGVVSLVLLWIFRWEASRSQAITAWGWALVIFASRAIPLALAVLGQKRWGRFAQRKVSGLLSEIPSVWACLTLGLGLVALPLWLWHFHPESLLVASSVVLTLGILSWFGFTWLVRRTGGFSGDMAGAFVCLCEVVLLFLLLGILGDTAGKIPKVW